MVKRLNGRTRLNLRQGEYEAERGNVTTWKDVQAREKAQERQLKRDEARAKRAAKKATLGRALFTEQELLNERSA